MFDMLNKLKDMKGKIEDVKKQLDDFSVEGEAENGLVKVTCNGNRKITTVTIDAYLAKEGNKGRLENLVLNAANNALEKAAIESEDKMKDAAKGVLPNIPGLM